MSQKVGLHVSAAGGVENAPENAQAFGAECFQFFSRSPRGGPAKPISETQAQLFRDRCAAYGFESYIHTPYYINFASRNPKIYHGSISAVREELERGTKLGVKYVMTHMGSARDWVTPSISVTPGVKGSQASTSSAWPEPVEGQTPGVETPPVPAAAIKQAIVGLTKIFDGSPQFTTQLLLEISAGAGAVLGDSFEELAKLLTGLGRKDVNVCLDTCHLFASGYDVRTTDAINETMAKFKKHLGISRLKLVHMNDSKAGLGEHKDRHEHMGKGQIGAKGLKAILNHPDFAKVNFILETEHDEFINDDIAFLKKHRVK